jgi:hypothetical protein
MLTLKAALICARVCFVGGFQVVLHGAGCSATFTDVRFGNCSLVVLAGASATVNGASFSHPTTAPSHFSVLADGPGTQVVMQMCDITGGARGIVVQGGAHVDVSDSRFEETLHTGVLAMDEGSSVSLTGCTIEEFPHEGNIRNDGVWIGSRATASLTSCNFAHAARACVYVSHASTVQMHDCVMMDASKGLYAVGEGSKVQCSSCMFLNNDETGVLAEDSAEVAVEGCKSNSNRLAGYAVTDASLWMRYWSSEQDEVGCSAGRGGELKAYMVDVFKAYQHGFSCEEHASMYLGVCTATESISKGFSCDTEASMVAVGCTAQANDLSGFAACNGSSLVLKGCCSRLNKADGIVATGSSTVNLSSSCCDENLESGVYVKDGNVLVDDVDVCRSGHAGVLVEQRGIAELKQCRVLGNEHYGLLVDGEGATIEVQHSVVEGNGEDAEAHSFGVIKVEACEGIESVNHLAWV